MCLCVHACVRVCTHMYIFMCVCVHTCVCSILIIALMVKLQDLKKAGVLIFANKQDLKGSMSSAEISQELNLASIKDHGWHIQGCCALTGEGLVHLFTL